MRQSPRTTPEAARPNPIPPIEFPEALPVCVRRDEIAAALRENPVIIVCGETGSGKTTQLPKIALGLGRGRANGGGLIGHTQPRRNLKGVAPKFVQLWTIFLGCFPFLGLVFVTMLLVYIFPQLVYWLPNLFYGN